MTSLCHVLMSDDDKMKEMEDKIERIILDRKNDHAKLQERLMSVYQNRFVKEDTELLRRQQRTSVYYLSKRCAEKMNTFDQFHIQRVY